MDYCLVVFASATTANRVASVLRKKFGIKTQLVQTPAAIPAPGCSYCLKLRCEDSNAAWKIIKENGLSSKGIFREKDYR